MSLVLNAVLAAWLWRGTTKHSTAGTAPVAPSALPVPAVKSTNNANAPFAALGSFMAENNRIPDLKWTAPQFAAFQEGFKASYEGRGLPLDEDARRLRDEISDKVQGMLAREQPSPVEDYFRVLREKEGVAKTSSGLHYRITEPGFGPTPTAKDQVVLSFAARLPDGRELPPLTRTRVKMNVSDLLPGLSEGVQLLRVGGKALVYLPPKLAYTEETWPPQIPKGVPLAFFVELHEIEAPGSK